MKLDHRWLWVIIGLFLLDFADAWSQVPDGDLTKKGQYVFAMAGGCACHSEPKGLQNAGARPFPIPFGTLYSTNITPDKATGLGDWTDQQIRDAIVKGVRRDGSLLLPVMPYEKYSGMAEDDLKALIAYLRTLKPAYKATPELKSWAPFARSIGARFISRSSVVSQASRRKRQSAAWNAAVTWSNMLPSAAIATHREIASACPTERFTWPEWLRKPARWANASRTLPQTEKPASVTGIVKRSPNYLNRASKPISIRSKG